MSHGTVANTANLGAIEAIYNSGKAGMIGISNVNASQLASLIQNAKVKPMAVQNRCFGRWWNSSHKADVSNAKHRSREN